MNLTGGFEERGKGTRYHHFFKGGESKARKGKGLAPVNQ